MHGSAGAGLTSRKLGTDDIAEEEGARSTSLLLELGLEGLGDGVCTRVDVTGEENGETLLLLRGVRFTENLDDSLVREPIGNGLRGRTKKIGELGSRQSGLSEDSAYGTSLESSAEFSSGDVSGDGTLGDLVDGHVDVLIRDVGHHLEGNLEQKGRINETKLYIMLTRRDPPSRCRARPCIG